MTAPRARLLAGLAHAAFAVAGAGLLWAAGQPLFTDDAWWHLGLGRAFSEHGPRLAGDPLLFTAPGPPDTAAWLADVAAFQLWHAAGFTGLRAAHVAVVASILALVWSLLRRAGRSPALASAGTLAFVALAAYRLVQLRPELVTLLATPLLYRLLLEREEPASPRRIALAALALGLWANCHAGFVLGLLLLAAGALGLAVGSALRAPADAARDRARARRTGIALALGFAATLANPGFLAPHLAWLRAGGDTPELIRVADEWARFSPFDAPVANLPPTPLAFALQWALLVLTPVCVGLALRRRRAAEPDAAASSPTAADRALVAWSLACLVAPFVAVRFLWLGLFPLLVLARAAAAYTPVRRAALAAAFACAIAPAFFLRGDWRMISNLLPRTLEGYAQPYAVAKYYPHPLFFLEDAQLEGNVWADYALGGFLGFRGAPARRAYLNGSLNVTRDAMEANLPIRERRGGRGGESFLALLDRMQIDVFVGTRLPQANPSRRPWFYTTAHLEHAPGWTRVFRNLDSAVYLRANERNAANLARVADSYASEDVPFDPERGFDPAAAVRDARAWSVAHGLVPVYLDELVAAAAAAREPDTRAAASAQLAALYASLGLYEHALHLDRRALRANAEDVPARRRAVWCLLRLGRYEEANAEAQPLLATPRGDALSRAIAETARDAARGASAETIASRVATLPVLTANEASQLLLGGVAPEPRARLRAEP